MLCPQQRVVSASACGSAASALSVCLSFPGWLAFPGCPSQQCQGAREGITSSSTTLNLFNLCKLPFSFRYILKATSKSSPRSLSCFQDICIICNSQLASACAGYMLFTEPFPTGWFLNFFSAIKNTSAISRRDCCRGR